MDERLHWQMCPLFSEKLDPELVRATDVVLSIDCVMLAAAECKLDETLEVELAKLAVIEGCDCVAVISFCVAVVASVTKY